MPGSYQVREHEKHEQKLKEIREQVANGTLVIRKMTAAERKRFPPREPGAAAAKRRPRSR